MEWHLPFELTILHVVLTGGRLAWLNWRMSFSKIITEKLKALPDEPGCYLMRDRDGKIVYVGKAASLRKRVQS